MAVQSPTGGLLILRRLCTWFPRKTVVGAACGPCSLAFTESDGSFGASRLIVGRVSASLNRVRHRPRPQGDCR